MNLEQVKLGDVADMLSGFAFKSAEFLDHAEEGVCLVRGDNVQQGYIRWGEKAKKWRSDAYDDLSRYHLQRDDVILAMDRPIVGGGLKLAWIKEQDLPSLLVQRVTRIRGVNDKVRTNFLRYVLSTPDFLAHIDRITTGANIPHISGKDIASFSFQLPNLDVQDRIVDCIAAYDDLIENNQRRIALLEESARLLYSEWFVSLRFPGHESVVMANGIPEGWSRVAIGQTIDFHIGGGWGKEFYEGTSPDAAYVIRGTDIPHIQKGDVAGVPLRFHPEKNLASRKLELGDIVFEVSGGSRDQGVGRLLHLTSKLLDQFDKPVMCASFCKLIRPKQGFSELLACTLDYLRSSAALKVYENQSASNIINFAFTEFCEKQEVLIPDELVLHAYRSSITPIWEQIGTLARQQSKLAQVRNLLLPKLMSGEIQV